MVGDCYTQSVMMSDLSIAVALRLGFLTASVYNYAGPDSVASRASCLSPARHAKAREIDIRHLVPFYLVLAAPVDRQHAHLAGERNQIIAQFLDLPSVAGDDLSSRRRSNSAANSGNSSSSRALSALGETLGRAR